MNFIPLALSILCLYSPVRVRSCVENALHLMAFGQFLHLQHVKHAIVVQTRTPGQNLAQLRELTSKLNVRFFNVNNSTTTTTLNFDELFYVRQPKVGIFVPQSNGDDYDDALVRVKVFVAASLRDGFNNSHAWFIVGRENCTNEMRAVFEEFDLNVNADVTLVETQPNGSLRLYDVYKYCHGCDERVKMELKGHWNAVDGYTILPRFRQSFVSRRQNFENMTLRAGTTIREKPANYSALEFLANEQDNKQFDTMQRKTYQLMKLMEPMFNISFEVSFEDTWGGPQPDGNWTGVLGQLMYREIDFTICTFRFTLDRVQTWHFTPDIHTEILVFLFRHPRRSVIRNIFFEPFSQSVWYCVLLVVVLTFSLLAMHMHHERQRQRHRQRRRRLGQQEQQEQPEQHKSIAIEHELSGRFDFLLLLVTETILMQGPSPATFHCTSTRMLIMTTCVFSVMLLQFYSGFIVGSLLTPVPRTITSMDALYNSSFEIGMESVQYNYEIFAQTQIPIARDIYTKRICKQPNPNALTLRQGLELIRRGSFAFHVSINRAYRTLRSMLTDAEFCDLQEIYLNPPYATCSLLRKDSPYREHFSNAILRLRAAGLMQYNDKLWQVPKPDCTLNQQKEVEVDLEHFVPALVFLMLAMICSLFALLIECAISRMRKAAK